MNTGSKNRLSKYDFFTLNMTPAELQVLVLAEVQKFKEMVKSDKVSHYITFQGEGNKLNQATLIMTNGIVNSLYVNAPADQLSEAIVWVKQNNPHLKFEDANLAGQMNDDAVRNHKTAQLNFTNK